MEKSATETVEMHSSGRWIWNDRTQSLEFLSLETKEEVKEKKKTKASTYHEHFRKHLEKWQKNTARPAQLDAFKTSMKRSQKKSCVTIQDVKLAAVCLIQENEALPIPLRFLSMLKRRELNEFLANLLLYFSCFFKKKTLEEKPESLMAEESESERTAAGARLKEDLALKMLADSYSTLLLGKRMRRHTARDGMKVSSTHSDIQLSECLYSFCIYTVWVTFERRDLKAIQIEIGRLFRSDTFNPALKTELNQSEETPEDRKSSQTEGQCEVVKPQQLNNRPKRVSVVLGQRSPLLVSLLPTPREKAPHLFEGFMRLPPPWTEHSETETLTEELQEQRNALSFGILGKPLSQFSSRTLKTQEGQSEEEEEEEGDEGEVKNADPRRTSLTGQRSQTSLRDRRSSRVNLVSRATTEAPSSDTE